MPGRGTAHSTEDLFLSCQTTTPYCVPLCALCVRVNSKVEHAVPLPGTLLWPTIPESLMQIGSAMCELLGNELRKSAVLGYQSLAPLGFEEVDVSHKRHTQGRKRHERNYIPKW